MPPVEEPAVGPAHHESEPAFVESEEPLMPSIEEPVAGPAHHEDEPAVQSQPGSLDQEDSVQEMSGYIEQGKMGEENLFEGEEEPYEVPDRMEVR